MVKEGENSSLGHDDFSILKGDERFQERQRDKKKRQKRRSKKQKFDRREEPPASSGIVTSQHSVEGKESGADWSSIVVDSLEGYARDIYNKLQSIGVTAKTDKFDQHFLVDQDAIRTLVASANISSGDSVLEIGPGPGNITEEIWRCCREVRASLSTIELDESFHPLLENLPEASQINMKWGDALMLLSSAAKQHGVNKVVANIPYSILEPLLKEIHASRSIQMAVLFVGKKYADRAVADFREEDPAREPFSKTALFSQARFSPEIVANIHRESCLPPPRTENAIVRLNQRKGINVNFVTIANTIIHRPTMLVRAMLQNILQQKFDKRKITQIRSLEDAREMQNILPPSVDQLGLPQELLRSTLVSLNNEGLQTLLLKLDQLRKRQKRDRMSEDES
ncbi:MAG TPA: rRNA adenine N-6-methyltransferase family protein [Candidatus Peribacteraceae bacterium]|nr:rRNA adenine N-6-methyltransferase family protein [Candidatus Peribacteraceae bacterium]